MREILFKGKTIKEGKWIEGSLIIDTRGNCYIGEYIPLNKDISIISGRTQGKTLNQFAGIGFAMVDPTTVCQYTGLKDKNGKKIFEGDILRIGLKDNVVVEWYKEQAKFELKLGTHYVAGFNEFTMEHYEIIGNIFDNKDLIKE